MNFSFTSAYDDNFSSIRFVSSAYSQKIKEKLVVRTSLAKNFKNEFYSEIIRSELAYQIFKQFNLSVGGIFLIEQSNGFINTGGTVGFKISY